MATPGAPANISVGPGLNPATVIVKWDAVVADPVVTHYTVYLDDNTGVGAAQFRKRKLKTTALKQVFQGLLTWRTVFATVTATNSEATGNAGTEGSGVARTRV